MTVREADSLLRGSNCPGRFQYATKRAVGTGRSERVGWYSLSYPLTSSRRNDRGLPTIAFISVRASQQKQSTSQMPNADACSRYELLCGRLCQIQICSQRKPLPSAASAQTVCYECARNAYSADSCDISTWRGRLQKLECWQRLSGCTRRDPGFSGGVERSRRAGLL